MEVQMRYLKRKVEEGQLLISLNSLTPEFLKIPECFLHFVLLFFPPTPPLFSTVCDLGTTSSILRVWSCPAVPGLSLHTWGVDCPVLQEHEAALNPSHLDMLHFPKVYSLTPALSFPQVPYTSCTLLLCFQCHQLCEWWQGSQQWIVLFLFSILLRFFPPIYCSISRL